MSEDGPPNKKVCVKNEELSDEESGSDDDKDEDFARPMVDIDAIASAKSLGDAMRILAPQLEGLPRRPRGKYGKRKNLTPEEKAEREPNSHCRSKYPHLAPRGPRPIHSRHKSGAGLEVEAERGDAEAVKGESSPLPREPPPQ